ncbi:MAG TPA: hypothetical protein HA252_00660 [Candidatus Diapherotrites archaeon]|uniref:Uncharacterized protein n=1 Tax=Candidatus Iainarchaeum sp. TaxID=3101447 RepID=A0A7J4JFK2_9ARCH|nr:hypothetical protein [Candidatus Diapherotrites archaeon]HIH15900.1 hypothetical protein [Candidatus Diapherotrites archaeon]
MAWLKRKAREPVEQNPDRLLHQKEVVVPFQHLSPALREFITDIPAQRRVRGIAELGATSIIGVTGGLVGGGVPPEAGFPLLFMASTAGMFAANTRTKVAEAIQEAYAHASHIMGHAGILDTKFEGHYPRDWMHPGVVANYHPIFFVDGKGNLHFLRQNKRGEAFRHRWQQTKPGKLGFTAWRWRGYLRPPKFPAKEVSLARRLAQSLQRQFLRSQLAPAPTQLGRRRPTNMRFRRARAP